jgi:hypothetical protein
VSVDVDFNRRVHADHTETADDLRGVGDLLRAQKQLGSVLVPILVETLETIGGETDGGGRSEVQVAGVEEVEEGVLEDFCPYLEVLEVCTSGLPFCQ